MYLRSILALTIVLALPLLLSASSPAASALDNADNDDYENRIAWLEEQLAGLENVPDQLANIVDILSSMSERITLLENEREEESSEARTMSVMAFSPDGDFEPTFLSLSLSAIQTGGWEPLELASGSYALLWVLDTQTSNPIDSGLIALTPPMFSTGGDDMWWMMSMQGDGVGFTVEVQNGLAVLPAPEQMEGLWSGRVTSYGHSDMSFFYTVGAGGEKPTTVTVSRIITTPMVLVRGQAGVISAVDNMNNTVSGLTLVINGMTYSNPASIVTPDTSTLSIEARKGESVVYGPTIMSTVEAEKQPEPSGTSIDATVVATVIVILVILGIVVFGIRTGRIRLGSGAPKKT